MAIDVGDACINRSQTLGQNTAIAGGNPANATGTIDYICIYVASAMGGAGPTICSCTEDGNDNITTRACVSPGQAAAGEHIYNAPGDFTAFDINFGDYIGIDTPDGSLDKGNVGANYWYKTGFGIFPCTGVAFTEYSPRSLSLYCTGPEAEGEEALSIPIAMHYQKQLRN